MPKINFEIFTDVNISPCFGSQIKMLMVDDRSGKFFHLDPLGIRRVEEASGEFLLSTQQRKLIVFKNSYRS